jgi:hypothetical protein
MFDGENLLSLEQEMLFLLLYLALAGPHCPASTRLAAARVAVAATAAAHGARSSAAQRHLRRSAALVDLNN